MSSTFEGFSISGFQYSGRKSFDSFPGVICWIDARVGVTKQAANSGQRVKTFTERGPYSFLWNEQNASTGVFMQTNGGLLSFTASSVQGGMQRAVSPNAAKWKAISDGSPWRIYYLMRVTSGATGSSNLFFPMDALFAEAGFRIGGNPASGTGRRNITFTIYDDSAAAIFSLNTGQDAYAYSTWSLVEIYHKGIANAVGNDMELYVNDVLKGAANWGAVTPGSTYNQPDLMETNSGASSCAMAFAAVYDDTGKGPSQIVTERMEIRALIQELYGV